MNDLITQERLKKVLEYNPDTGEFNWIIRSRGIKQGRQAGSIQGNGYRQIYIDGRFYRAHRLAWLYVYGEMPSKFIDHIDGNRSNNAISNLRQASNSENSQNKRAGSKNSSTGILGVSWEEKRKKYHVSIGINGKYKFIGRYKTEEEARDAYLEAKQKLHPFAPSNVANYRQDNPPPAPKQPGGFHLGQT